MSNLTPSKFRARVLSAFVVLFSAAMMSCCPPALLSGKSACGEPKSETSSAKKATASPEASTTEKGPPASH